MEEERIGFLKAAASSIVVGIYVGLAGATFSILSDPMDLTRHGNILLYAAVISSIVLTPVLWNRKVEHGHKMEINIEQLMEELSQFDEGRGRWRFLSHVKDEKVRLSIDLRHSNNSITIVEKTFQLYKNHPVRYIVGHSNEEHNNLRNNVLEMVKRLEGDIEIKSFSKSIEICARESDKILKRRRNISAIILFGLIMFIIQFLLDNMFG